MSNHRAELSYAGNACRRRAAEIRPAAVTRAREAGGPAMRTRVLLIAEDELLVAQAKRIVERAGCPFHAARTAREGLALATSIKPDVILIDDAMPGLDGNGTRMGWTHRLRTSGAFEANVNGRFRDGTPD